MDCQNAHAGIRKHGGGIRKLLKHTQTHTPFYGPMDFVQDIPGEPVPER